MSSFLETKPLRGPLFLGYALAIAAVAFTLNFAFYNFMTGNVAVKEAEHKIEEKRLEVLAKFKAAELKKLPKGTKPDPKALGEAAEKAFKADHKAQEAFEKVEHEQEHHAYAGVIPMISFVAIVSAIVSGLAGSLLVIRRTKDAGTNAWFSFFVQIPVFAAFALVAFLPFLSGLAHHEGAGLVEFVKSDVPVAIGVVIALLGVVLKLVLTALPSDPHAGEDDHAH